MKPRVLYPAFLSLLLTLCFSLVHEEGWGQIPNGFLNFGTTTNGTTATTLNTGFGGVRVGTQGGGFTIMNTGQTIGSDAELRGIAPTGGSINSVGITSAEYGTASTTFTISFEIHFSGGSSGTWYFFAGNGSSFAATQTNGFTSSQVFSGLRWVLGSAGTITTNNRAGNTWNSTGISGTPFIQNTSYFVTIVGNNSSSTVNYGVSQTIASYKFDFWINGVLIGNDIAKGELSNGTSINAFRFYGENSTSNVAQIALDNIRWYNSCVLPPTHLTFVGLPSTGTINTNLTSFTVETRSGSAEGPIANSYTGAITVEKASGSGSVSGTLNPNAVAGVATFSNIQMDASSTYTLTASSASPILTATSANIIILKDEPSNHPTNFLVDGGIPAYLNIDGVWDDATGTVVPDGYLIKGSSISYAAITDPQDGIAEANSSLVKNVTAGAETVNFSGLNSETTYYFKIFPYTNSGSNINYKTDGTVLTSEFTTVAPYSLATDYFRTITSGDWSSSSTWESSYDNSVWNLATLSPGSSANDITIRNSHNVTLTESISISNDLIVNDFGMLEMGEYSISGTGSFTLSSGAALRTAITTGLNGAVNVSGSKVFSSGANYMFNGTSAQVTGASFPASCTNLTINNPAGVSLSGGTSVSGTLYLTAGALNIGANTLGISGTISKTDGSLVGGTTSNMSITGAGANLSLPVTSLGNLTINRANGVSMTGDLALAGLLTLSNGEFTIGANTLTLNGTCAETSGTLGGGNSSSIIIGENVSSLTIPAVTLGNLTLNRAAGAVLGGNVTVNTLLTLTNGALTHSSYQFTMGDGATIARSGGSVAMGLAFAGNINVEYNQHSSSITPGYEIPNENVGGTLTNLTLNSTNGVDFDLSPTIPWVAGTLTINAGTFTLNGQDLKILGSIVNSGGSVDFSPGNVTYESSGATTIFPTTYGNLSLTGAGTKTLGGDTYVNEAFNLQSNVLVMDGYILELYGTITGTGSLFGDDMASLAFGGSGNVGNLRFAPGGQILHDMYLLLLDGNSFVTLTSNLHIDDVLSTGSGLIIDEGYLVVEPGIELTIDKTLAINVPRGLILKANASAMASIIPGTSTTYSNGGTAVVERFSAAGTVGYFSSPVTGATRNVFAGSVNDRLYQYKATTGGWELIDIDETVLEIMRGYVAKYANPTTLLFEGQLVNGTQTAGTGGHVTLANGGTYGWNLVGNTYPSALDVESAGFVMGTQIQPFVSMRKSDGNVGYYSKTSHLGNNGGSRYIPPTQAFWINLEAATDIGFSFSNTARVHTAQNIYKSFEEPEAFRLTVWRGTHSDEMTVAFLDNAQETHEMYDADKLFINDTNFGMVYSVSADARNLAINGLPPLTGDRDVPLGFEALKAGNYSFSANVEALDPAIAVNLEDTEAGIMQDLRQNPEYNFTSGVVNTTSRFILHFHTTKVSGQVVYDHASTPWPLANAKVKLLNATGDEVSSTTCDANGHFSFDMVPYGSRLQISTNLPGAGWNAADALEAMKHFTGLSTLGGLTLTAADANGNGYVNSVDAMLIQKRFVSMITTFPAGEWVFEEKIFTPETAGNTETIQIKGLCVGDVNRSNQ